MRKRIISLLLALILCASVPAAAAAGNADDPLISRSYISDIFLPQVIAALERIAENKLNSARDPAAATEAGLHILTLHQGDTLSLTGGQQLVLVSGEIRLTIEIGKLLNVTAGRTSIGGDAQLGNRYLIRANSTVTAAAKSDAVVAVSLSVAKTAAEPEPAQEPEDVPISGECPFTDVASSAWYYTDVLSAYTSGLVNGISAKSYAPEDDLTVAQAIKLAACMHQLYHTGSVTLTNSDGNQAWYMSYVDYAKEQGILKISFRSYDVAITRSDFIVLFYQALPEKEYTRINLIMDGAIPDVATDAAIAKEVYTFYMAGILTGYTAGGGYPEHAFGPESKISRAEVAAIMNRMFHSEMRKHFTMD